MYMLYIRLEWILLYDMAVYFFYAGKTASEETGITKLPAQQHILLHSSPPPFPRSHFPLPPSTIKERKQAALLSLLFSQPLMQKTTLQKTKSAFSLTPSPLPSCHLATRRRESNPP